MVALNLVPTEALLKELISRHKLAPSPKKRTFFEPHQEAIVAIGKDGHATITVHPDDLKILLGKT